MTLQRAALAIMISAALLAVPAALDDNALACSCAEPRPVSEVYQGSDAVFVGRAVDVRPEGRSTAVQFKVDMAWKGVPDDTVVLRTADSGVSCGYPFEEGRDYLVYASGDPGHLETGLCGRTQPFDTAFSDLAYLGPGYIPELGQPVVEKDPSGSWMLALLVGVAAAGTVVFAVARRRSKDFDSSGP